MKLLFSFTADVLNNVSNFLKKCSYLPEAAVNAYLDKPSTARYCFQKNPQIFPFQLTSWNRKNAGLRTFKYFDLTELNDKAAAVHDKTAIKRKTQVTKPTNLRNGNSMQITHEKHDSILMLDKIKSYQQFMNIFSEVLHM